MISPISFDALAERRAFSTADVMNRCLSYVNEFLETHFNGDRLIVSVPQDTLPESFRDDIMNRLVSEYKEAGFVVWQEDGCLAFSGARV